MPDLAGAVHIAGARTLTPGEPRRRLLHTADGRIAVDVELGDPRAGPNPQLSFVNGSGQPLRAVVARVPGGPGAAPLRLEPGENVLELPLEAGAGSLSLQAAPAAGAPADMLTLVVTAETTESGGVAVVAQLLARAERSR